MAIDKELDFTGKTILVTGSGWNIGCAIIVVMGAAGELKTGVPRHTAGARCPSRKPESVETLDMYFGHDHS